MMLKDALHNAAGEALLTRFADVPVLVAKDEVGRFERALTALAREDKFAEFATAHAAEDGFWPQPGSYMARLRPYVVQGGVLQIPVKGILLHDFPYAFGSMATGYVYLRRARERGLADPDVKGIAYIHDTPGGEVAGCFDEVDAIYAARGQKPMRAFAHESSYSAGYALACAAQGITVARTGGVGSIGVVRMHVDLSQAYEQAGIKITLIEAPKDGHKTDNYPYKPLSADAERRNQQRADAIYELFVTTVARNRDMKSEAVRATDGLTFMASESVSNGLADKVGAIDDEVAAFAADLSASEGNEEMSTASGGDKAATFTQADLDRARAEGRAEGDTAGKDAGRKEGATAERSRCKAILGHAAAEGRGEFASYLAFDTDTPAEQAATMLEKAPKGESSLSAQMRGETDPQLGPGSTQRRESSGAMTPAEVAAAVNEQFGGTK